LIQEAVGIGLTHVDLILMELVQAIILALTIVVLSNVLTKISLSNMGLVLSMDRFVKTTFMFTIPVT
jgi:hypothetical protein